jgi:hypothetical protein
LNQPKKCVSEFEEVTGVKASFDLIPHQAYIQALTPYLGEFVAIDLWEMFQAFSDIGFGAAGEPEVLANTKGVFCFAKKC